MNKIVIILLAFVCVFNAFGQTAATPASPDPPQYLVGVGGEYNRYASPAGGMLASLAVRIASTRIYSWSTIDMPIAPLAPTDRLRPPSAQVRLTSLHNLVRHMCSFSVMPA